MMRTDGIIKYQQAQTTFTFGGDQIFQRTNEFAEKQ